MVIDEVRKAVGPMIPISLRLSVDELVEGGNTVDDCLEYLEFLMMRLIFSIPPPL